MMNEVSSTSRKRELKIQFLPIVLLLLCLVIAACGAGGAGGGKPDPVCKSTGSCVNKDLGIIISYPNSATSWEQEAAGTYAEWSGISGSQVKFEMYKGDTLLGEYHMWTDNDQYVGRTAAMPDWGTGNDFRLKISNQDGYFGWSDFFSISSWSQWRSDSSLIDGSAGVTLEESNGQLTITVPEPDANCDTHYLWSSEKNLPSDFSVEYKFEKQGSGHSSLLLSSSGVLDGSVNDNILELYISTNDTPYIRVRTKEAGSGSVLFETSNAGYLNVPLTFRIERNDSRFYFYVNGDQIGSNFSNSVLDTDTSITLGLATGTCTWKSGDGVDVIESVSVQSGGGGNVVPPTNEAECDDFSGTWAVTDTFDLSNCGGGDHVDTYTAVISQNGCSLTWTDPSGTYQGTVIGSNYSGTETYNDFGGSLNADFSLDISGDTLSGSFTWTFTDGSNSCTGSTAVSAIKQ